MLTGGCYCGRIRYEADGEPFNATLCHCVDCRRIAGSPCVAWFSIDPAKLRFVADAPQRFASSPQVIRSFCPTCGTPLTFQQAELAGEIDIATCSLDDPEAVPPQDHVRTGQRLSWIHLDDGLPHYPVVRPPEPGP